MPYSLKESPVDDAISKLAGSKSPKDQQTVALLNKFKVDPSVMSNEELQFLRNQFDDKHPLQSLIAPFEHQSFARESVQNNPLTAIPLAAAIPAYSLKKMVMKSPEETSTSLKQVSMGYQGLLEGLGSKL